MAASMKMQARGRPAKADPRGIPPKSSVIPLWACAASLAAVVALSGWARASLLSVPFERDEGEYAYMGQLINQGIPPYVAAYNMKLPGTYGLYAVFLRLFGDTAEAVRIGLLLTNAASIVLVFLLARRLVTPAAALAGATAYAAMSLSPTVLGTFAHATHFVMVFALGGLVCLAQAIRSGRSWVFVASGLLFGLSILMKQNGVFFAGLGLLQIGWHEWTAAPRYLRRLATRLGPLGLGLALPLIGTGLALYASGAWPRFWFWVVTYGGAYVSQVPLRQAFDYLAYTGKPVITAAPLLALMALAGLGLAAWNAWQAKRPSFALAFAIVSAAAVCPGFWFRPHYYLLALPAAAVLVAIAADALERSLTGSFGPTGRGATAVALAALAGAQALYSNRIILFEASPPESARLTYPQQPFPEAVEIAAYLRAHTGPDDRIAVLGSEPQIYFYARRRGATGYLYTYPMMEPQPFAKRMQDEMIREIEGAPPSHVVFVETKGSWTARPESDLSIVEWTNRFLRARYQRVGVVEIPDDDGPGFYYWDDAVRTYRQRFKNRVLVYRRTS